jgi:hypothetical protein
VKGEMSGKDARTDRLKGANFNGKALSGRMGRSAWKSILTPPQGKLNINDRSFVLMIGDAGWRNMRALHEQADGDGR